MNMGKLLIFVLTSLLLIGNIGTTPAQAQSPIKIGWIGPLTGNAAVLGVDSLPALRIAFQKINQNSGIDGRLLEVVAEDDQYITSKTVTAYEKLVHQDGIKIIVVLTYGGLFAIAPRSQKDGVVLIDPLDCDSAIAKLPQNIFCVAKTTEDLGVRATEDAISRGFNTIGMIYYDGDPFMGTVAKTSNQHLISHGVDVAFLESYNDATTDFKPILIKAKQKNIKALFLWGYDQIGLAMKQARQLGVTAQFYALSTISSPGAQALAGQYSNDTIVSIWLAEHDQKYQDFLKSFKAAVGRPPNMDLCAIPTYDVGQLIISGLQSTKTLKDFLYTVKDFAGLSGQITIDSDGATRNFKIQLQKFRNGKFEITK